MAIKGQATTVLYYAEDVVNGGGKAGDGGNHTLRVAADGTLGTVAASPAEVSSAFLKGVYSVVVAAGENSGSTMLLGGNSATAGIVIRPVQWSNVANVAAWLGATVPAPNAAGYPLVDLSKVNGVAAGASDGTAQAGGTTTITLASTASAVDNSYRDWRLQAVGGAGAGQYAYVTAYVGATKVATLDRTVGTAFDPSTQYVLDPPAAANVLEVAGKAATAAAPVAFLASVGTPTADVAQTGDAYARLGAAGAGLTALGDARLAHLDADVSTRSTYAGGAVASVTGNVGGNVTGSVGSVAAEVSANLTHWLGVAPLALSSQLVQASASVSLGAAAPAGWINAAAFAAGAITATVAPNLDATVSSRLPTTGYTAPPSDYQQRAVAVTLPSIPANWITAAGINAGALNGKGDWNALAPPASSVIAAAVWDQATSGHATSGTFGAAMNAAGSAGDPWATSLPGAYGAGTAGAIVGTNVDARLSLVKAKTDNLPASPAAVGSAMAVADKTGFSLAAAGLDAISVADPGGVGNMTTLPRLMVALWRRFYGKSTLTATQLKTYAADGATVNATQPVSDDGVTQTQGAAV